MAELCSDRTMADNPVPALRRIAMPASIEPGPAWNDPRLHRACIPGMGGLGTASAVARLFAPLAKEGEFGGIRFLSRDRVRSFCTPRSNGNECDEIIGYVPWLGTGGFWIGGAEMAESHYTRL